MTTDVSTASASSSAAMTFDPSEARLSAAGCSGNSREGDCSVATAARGENGDDSGCLVVDDDEDCGAEVNGNAVIVADGDSTGLLGERPISVGGDFIS